MYIFLHGDDLYCPNENCDNHGKKGAGNIIIHNRYGKDQKRLLKCRTCNSKFSERRISLFYGMHTNEGKIKEVIEYLLNGMSYREAASAAKIDKDTVQRIWKRFIQYCEESMDSILDEFNVKLEDFIMLLSQKMQKSSKYTG